MNSLVRMLFVSLVALPIVLLICGIARAVEVPLDTKQSSFKFIGHAFLHDFIGEAKAFSGSAQIDPKNPVFITSAEIKIQAAKLTTFEGTRDRNMAAWLQVDSRPDILFELTRVSPLKGSPDTATRAKPSLFKVEGNFALNKITKPLEAQAVGWREGRVLMVTGTTAIYTNQYGLPIIRQFFMTVDEKVDVDFRLVFSLPPEIRKPD